MLCRRTTYFTDSLFYRFRLDYFTDSDYFTDFTHILQISLRHWNTGLVSSLTSWGEVASLALVGSPSSDSVTIKMPYGVDVLHQPASHPIFFYWVG